MQHHFLEVAGSREILMHAADSRGLLDKGQGRLD